MRHAGAREVLSVSRGLRSKAAGERIKVTFSSIYLTRDLKDLVGWSWVKFPGWWVGGGLVSAVGSVQAGRC